MTSDSAPSAIPTGGSRSLETLEELGYARIKAFGTSRASRAVSDLAWNRAQSYAIQRDDARSIWHAGHVTAILSNDVDVIAATQTGGLWLLNSIVGPSPLAGYTGVPLSEQWDTPDISALSWGVEASQVFVGTNADALYLVEFDTALGGHLTLRQSTILPLPFKGASAIVTLANPARVVVATASPYGGGVWWSPIPNPPSSASGYDWHLAEGLDGARYTSLAAGPGESVVAAGSGGPSLGIGVPAGASIYRGTFQGGVLGFAAAQVFGATLSSMRRTSLASCDNQRQCMYAVGAAGDGTIAAVLRSLDGGATWRVRTTPDNTVAGLQGGYANCIAVSPQRQDLVVVGWTSGGPFWSQDGGASWLHPQDQGSIPHLHADLHALYFGRSPGLPEVLYVGGDGGITVTKDLGATYHSQFNRPLNNLQFYGARPSVLGTYAGSLTASSRYPGLLAGGTQDNGNLYRLPDTRRAGVPRQADTPWLKHVGGDGDLNRFVDPLGALLNFNNGTPQLRMAVWDEATRRFPSPGIVPADDNPGGIMPTAVEIVHEPTFRRDHQLMYAVVGSSADGMIHGLFADDPSGDRPEAANARLVRLGFVGGLVSAIGSLGGATLMIGTDNGRIVSFDSASGTLTDYALPDIATGVVSRIEVFPPASAAGALPDNAYALVDDRILRFNGLFWSTTTGTNWLTFAFDRPTGRLFGATDGDVFVSHDRALSWVDASVGLPMKPHCTDLRIAADGQGGSDLYLATYGRSVWRATVSQRSEIFELPPATVEILIGVIEDGGGVIRLGGRLIKLGPRPLTRDILAALVVNDVAQTMSDDSEANSRAIRRAALQQIADIALREVQQLE
ncbi:MAG: hypothetical protein ABIX28_07290 [Vicinamibacterales bacterium]